MRIEKQAEQERADAEAPPPPPPPPEELKRLDGLGPTFNMRSGWINGYI